MEVRRHLLEVAFLLSYVGPKNWTQVIRLTASSSTCRVICLVLEKSKRRMFSSPYIVLKVHWNSACFERQFQQPPFIANGLGTCWHTIFLCLPMLPPHLLNLWSIFKSCCCVLYCSSFPELFIIDSSWMEWCGFVLFFFHHCSLEPTCLPLP